MSTDDFTPRPEARPLLIFNKYEERVIVDAMALRIYQLKMQRYQKDEVDAEIATLLSILRRLGYGVTKQERQ